jgi:hypothetical protein
MVDERNREYGRERVVEDGRGDLAAYVGDTAYFSKREGAVVAEGVEHGSYRTIVSTAGLAAYPAAGDTLHADVTLETPVTYGGVLFGV